MAEQETVRAHLVVIGAPGAGKTRLGKRIARLLRVPFIDTDKRIVAVHGPIRELFAEHGEAYFRNIERQVVAESLREPAVVALGGGAVLDSHTAAQLVGARVAQLTVSADAVSERIGGSKRPLLKNGVDDWVRLVDSRRSTYDRLASRTWDTSAVPLDSLAAEIADWVARDMATQKATPKEQRQ